MRLCILTFGFLAAIVAADAFGDEAKEKGAAILVDLASIWR